MTTNKTNIKIMCDGVTGRDLSELGMQLNTNTGYSYGYHILEMKDTTTHTFILTLCVKKRVLKRDAYGIMCFVKGFLLGRGISVYHNSWVY